MPLQKFKDFLKRNKSKDTGTPLASEEEFKHIKKLVKKAGGSDKLDAIGPAGSDKFNVMDNKGNEFVVDLKKNIVKEV